MGLGYHLAMTQWREILPSLSLERLRLFMPLKRGVGWMLIHWVDLRIDSNSWSELGFIYPMRRIGLVTSPVRRYAFTSLPSSVG